MNKIDEMQQEIFDFAYELVHEKTIVIHKELLEIYEDDEDAAGEIYNEIHGALLRKLIDKVACTWQKPKPLKYEAGQFSFSPENGL